MGLRASGDVLRGFHMSNVLIGIIGVILFIGLALAGALFLGPRFQEATNNSKASANVQAMQQVIAAANMYELTNGKADLPLDVTIDANSALVTGGFLKSVPSDSSGRNATYVLTRRSGMDYVHIGLQSLAVCKAVQKQLDPSATTYDAGIVTTKIGGCYGSGNENEFLLYMRK
jgi:type II secretory pathway pseudopilin PulG